MGGILLIDDDKDDRELFSEALEGIGEGIKFHSVPDVDEAFRVLDAKEIPLPDLIFLDINMPVISGWQCLSRLKSTDAYKDIPVIMYSTSSYARDKEIAKDLGALCFLTKPQEYRVLKNILDIVLDHLRRRNLPSVCTAIHSDGSFLS